MKIEMEQSRGTKRMGKEWSSKGDSKGELVGAENAQHTIHTCTNKHSKDLNLRNTGF